MSETPQDAAKLYRGRRAGVTAMRLRAAQPVGASEDSSRREARATPLRAGYTPARLPPYRRRAVKPRPRRRSRVVRWLRPLLSLGLAVAVVAGAVVWLVTSPRFCVTTVEVRGGDPALSAWVQGRLAPLVGERLLLLSLDRVTGAVEKHPWIEALEVSRVLPDGLRVEIHPRRPAAVVELEGRWVYADSAGRPIATVGDSSPGAPARERLQDLLRVTGGRDDAHGVPEALAIRNEWVAAQPAWGGRVVGVEILNEADFRLQTTALPFPLLVRSGEVEGKVRWLEHLLPWLVAEWGEPAAVDLRFARRIVVDRTVAEKSDRSPGRGA